MTTKQQRNQVVAAVEKGPTSELRISLSTWRDAHKVELREYTEIVQGAHLATGTAVSVGVEQLPALITALQLAETEARRRGFLDGGAR